ncbi:MAG: GNAT family N-acetyltransferase [Bacillota bacterium]
MEVKEETIDSIFDYYNSPGRSLDWPFIFTLPSWLQAWWESFGKEWEPCLHSVWRGERLVGLAPLMRKKEVARLIGSADVCDYLDFVTVPGEEEDFFQVLLPALKEGGLKRLELESQHPGACIFNGLLAADPGSNFLRKLHFSREDLTFELPLPGDWEEYLAHLSKKQRHEVRRKLRRLASESDSYRYRVIEEQEAVKDFLPRFLALFGKNHEKANFLTAEREHFFRRVITAAADGGLARFGLLEIDREIAAAVLYFVYRGKVYLYNSGYAPAYRHLSAGLLSKVLCLKESIESGSAVFDFLKGAEVYKSRLGAKAVPVYQVSLALD